MIAQQRLNAAVEVLEHEFEPGKWPLSRFLSQWFKKNRQMGSTDRRTMSSLLYAYFRCIHLLKGLDKKNHFLAARFLLSSEDNQILPALKPEWIPHLEEPFDKKMMMLKDWFPEMSMGTIFPFHSHVSKHINFSDYENAYLNQPLLFIRVRTGFENSIISTLEQKKINFNKVTQHCLSFENQTNIDFLEVEFPGSYEVQDYCSQLSGTLFHPAPFSSLRT